MLLWNTISYVYWLSKYSHYSLSQQLVSQFIGLLCGKQYKLELSKNFFPVFTQLSASPKDLPETAHLKF